MNKLALVSALSIVAATNSFAFQVNPSKVSFSQSRSNLQTRLYAEDEPKSGKTASLKSGRKQIAFDEASGRFFETDGEEMCIPDEEYCMVDDKTGNVIRLTVEEKERIFVDALQSYYISGRQMLSDSEFDLLKEDLAWNGSQVATLNRKEAQYLAAMQAYMKGEPIISDAEFDTLKRELKEEESQFAVSKEPKCYIDTGICTVTFQEDFFRTNLLYLPAGLVLFVAWLGIGFEIIEPIIRINPLLLTLLGFPLIYNGSKKITQEYIFPNNRIAYGPCPSCEYENRVYFGDILGVEGFSDIATSKCPKCKVEFKVQANTLRASTLPKN